MLKLSRQVAQSPAVAANRLVQAPPVDEAEFPHDEPELGEPNSEHASDAVQRGSQEEIAAPSSEQEPSTLPQPNDLELTSIRDVSIDIRSPGELIPQDEGDSLVAAKETVYYRSVECADDLDHPFYISSPIFCHRPLYFEECCLERYGQHCGVFQPLASAAHFFRTLPAMPYKMLIDRPCDCVSAVGPYGPCDDGPCRRQWPPLRLDAAMVEASVVTGLILLIP